MPNLDDKKSKGKVARNALQEFLIHGVKYAFPAAIGAPRRGMPTAHSRAPLSEKILSSIPYVWPLKDGANQGPAIAPLYRSVPHAAKNDPDLYDLLAIVDTLRMGRARERELAVGALQASFAER